MIDIERLIIFGTTPSVNHMYAGHKRVKTKVAKEWYNDAILTARVWKTMNKWPTATGKVVLRLWFYFPNARKRDTHNALKILLDALEDAEIYVNDMYALPQIMDFEIDRKNPRIEIEFEVVQEVEANECKSSVVNS